MFRSLNVNKVLLLFHANENSLSTLKEIFIYFIFAYNCFIMCLLTCLCFFQVYFSTKFFYNILSMSVWLSWFNLILTMQSILVHRYLLLFWPMAWIVRFNIFLDFHVRLFILLYNDWLLILFFCIDFLFFLCNLNFTVVNIVIVLLLPFLSWPNDFIIF